MWGYYLSAAVIVLAIAIVILQLQINGLWGATKTVPGPVTHVLLRETCSHQDPEFDTPRDPDTSAWCPTCRGFSDATSVELGAEPTANAETRR